MCSPFISSFAAFTGVAAALACTLPAAVTFAGGEPCDPAWVRTFGPNPGTDGAVYSMIVHDDGGGSGPALYVAGAIATAGGSPASHIARWNGSRWSPLHSGMGEASLNGFVRALAVHDDGSGGGASLYVGGSFTSAAETPLNFIARWDGTAWSALGEGFTDPVLALTSFDDGTGTALYAGGNFLVAGGKPASKIARWDGSSWSAVGGGVDGLVSAMTVFDDGTGAALLSAAASRPPVERRPTGSRGGTDHRGRPSALASPFRCSGAW